MARPERRLAAILAADIAGYSRLRQWMRQERWRASTRCAQPSVAKARESCVDNPWFEHGPSTIPKGIEHLRHT
jgi:hypothetical protein